MKKQRVPEWAKLKPLDRDAAAGLQTLSKETSSTTQEYLRNMMSLLDGYRTPGGCDLCNADYTMYPDPESAVTMRVRIFHDDDCPMIN